MAAGSTSGLEYIKQDHDKFRTLFSQYKTTADKHAKVELVKQVYAAADTHSAGSLEGRHEHQLKEQEKCIETRRSVIYNWNHLMLQFVKDIGPHSSAEERYLYPLLIKHLKHGRMISDRHILDEQTQKEVLDYLERHIKDVEQELAGEEGKQPADGGEPSWVWKVFDDTVERFIMMLINHMREEETVALPALRDRLTPGEDAKLAKDMEWGKQHAPTHPHPEGPNTAIAARIVHPVMGVVDKAYDTIRETVTDVAARLKDQLPHAAAA